MHSTTFLVGALSTLAAAMEIDVTVGGSAGLVFTPNQVMASVGDVVNFHVNKNHSVAQSSFANPCNPINDNAIFSGFGVANFQVTVNDTKPVWIYCSQASHCASGMVFAINPTEMNTLEKYRDNAQGKGPSVSPMHAGGGVASGSNTGSDSGNSSSSSGSGYGYGSGSPSTAGSSGYGSGYDSSSSATVATATGSGSSAATGSPSGASSGSSNGTTSAAPSPSSPAAKGAAAALDVRAMRLLSVGAAAIVAAALI